MFTLSISLSTGDLPFLKDELKHKLPEIRPTHRAELLARWYGFRTYASLRTALSNSTTVTTNIDWESACQFLKKCGYEKSSVPLCDTSAKLALRRVADKLPRLTQFGIGFGPRQANTDGTRETSEQYNERFRQSREDLCTDYSAKAFLRSMAFLSEVGHIQTFSDSGSYWVKHIAENFPSDYPCGKPLGPDYVPNGLLIAAAVHSGFRIRTNPPWPQCDDPNVSFNMSRRDLVDWDCKVRPTGAHAQAREHRNRARRRTFVVNHV